MTKARSVLIPLGEFDSRARVGRVDGMKHEGLDRQAVDVRVDSARERAYFAAGDAFDGFAELADRGVLKKHARLAQPCVLAHLDEVALCGREGVLQDDGDHVARPCGSRGRRSATELLFEEA